MLLHLHLGSQGLREVGRRCIELRIPRLGRGCSSLLSTAGVEEAHSLGGVFRKHALHEVEELAQALQFRLHLVERHHGGLLAACRLALLLHCLLSFTLSPLQQCKAVHDLSQLSLHCRVVNHDTWRRRHVVVRPARTWALARPLDELRHALRPRRALVGRHRGFARLRRRPSHNGARGGNTRSRSFVRLHRCHIAAGSCICSRRFRLRTRRWQRCRRGLRLALLGVPGAAAARLHQWGARPRHDLLNLRTHKTWYGEQEVLDHVLDLAEPVVDLVELIAGLVQHLRIRHLYRQTPGQLLELQKILRRQVPGTPSSAPASAVELRRCRPGQRLWIDRSSGAETHAPDLGLKRRHFIGVLGRRAVPAPEEEGVPRCVFAAWPAGGGCGSHADARRRRHQSIRGVDHKPCADRLPELLLLGLLPALLLFGLLPALLLFGL
mmetsp:Transcript_65157/g.187283  ORF Transcript_65157/g.187283 Transcript_65157/m.187283 type:complete len:437 (+) Transcript_65157:833-2143(+)